MGTRIATDYKVLHAPISALYQPSLLVRGLRENGVDADLMYHDDLWQNYTFNLGDEIILGKGIISTLNYDFFLHALETYDIFHLHSGYSPIFQSRKEKELRLLKKAGKVIIIHGWGCIDSRLPGTFAQTRTQCGVCPLHRNNCNDSINGKRMEREFLYADAVIDCEVSIETDTPKCTYLAPSLDLEYWHPDLSIPEDAVIPRKRNGELRIIHAVGGGDRGDLKGTSVIEKAIHALKAEGFDIEYDFVNGVSFGDLRYRILQADIVIDQLRYGSFGSFAREGMALGKPVIGHVVKAQRDKLPDLPIIEANVDDFERVLRSVVSRPETLAELGRMGRTYSEEHFDYKTNAAQLKAIYESLLERAG